jgi:uncharacterized membrane protein YhaH (DUF805 family)
MDFISASILPLKRYAEFQGRSTRTEVIGFILLTSLFTSVMMFLASWLGMNGAKPWLEGALAAIFLLPNLTLSVRRLHDWGRSAWWLLVGSPLVLAVIWELIFYPPRPFTLHVQSHLPWWALVPVVLSVLGYYTLMLWPDDVDTNLYGPNPRGWTPPPGEPA